jgi:hypothetical protein
MFLCRSIFFLAGVSENEEAAACTYDLAAKYGGTDGTLNSPVSSENPVYIDLLIVSVL